MKRIFRLPALALALVSSSYIGGATPALSQEYPELNSLLADLLNDADNSPSKIFISSENQTNNDTILITIGDPEKYPIRVFIWKWIPVISPTCDGLNKTTFPGPKSPAYENNEFIKARYCITQGSVGSSAKTVQRDHKFYVAEFSIPIELAKTTDCKRDVPDDPEFPDLRKQLGCE